jgi:hypothetical protein
MGDFFFMFFNGANLRRNLRKVTFKHRHAPAKSLAARPLFQGGTSYSTCKSMTTTREFKFACPVCHQHIVCDAEAAGSQIECPTCYKQIIVPKAPGGATTKLILRGTQPKATPSRLATRIKPVPQPLAAHTSLTTLAALSALIALGTAMIFSHLNIFKQAHTESPVNQTSTSKPIALQ